jgi:hypothetical protein
MSLDLYEATYSSFLREELDSSMELWEQLGMIIRNLERGHYAGENRHQGSLLVRDLRSIYALMILQAENADLDTKTGMLKLTQRQKRAIDIVFD